MTNPFAAIYNFWLGVPAPMRAAITANTLSLNTAIGSALAYATVQGAFAHGTAGAVEWFQANWLATLAGFLWGGGVSGAVRVSKAGTYAPAPASPPTPPPPPPAGKDTP